MPLVGLLAIAIVAIVLVTLFDVAFRPTLRRLAVRNALRRKGEAALVIGGSMLGTAIITASFVVGDTLDASIRDEARTALGPVDVVVEAAFPDDLPDMERAATTEPLPGADGALTAVFSGATVARGEGEQRRAEPRAGVVEVDFDAARAFGPDASITGLAGAGPTPEAGEAVITTALASELGAAEGDTIEVFAYGQERAFTVRNVVPVVGLAGFPPDRGGTGGNVFVAPGTLDTLHRATVVPGPSPTGYLLVSGEGGVFAGAEGSEALAASVSERLWAFPGVEVRTSKADLLEAAADAGRQFSQLFISIGSFSIIAGVLLLVNIFVMLADERKTELGMLRALGMKRNHLVRAFGMEGGVYALAAAAAGAGAGVAVGWVMVQVISAAFASGGTPFGDVGGLRFAADPWSLGLGALVGAVIALLTVWATSLRISRLNVIAAIRDLPEGSGARDRARWMVLGTVGLAFFGLLWLGAVRNGQAVGALLFLPLALWSTIALLWQLVPRRLAVSVPCLGSLVWGIAVFSLLPEVMGGADVVVFVVMGVVLVGSAVALATVNDDLFNTVTDRLAGSGRGLALRLGLAYPLARRFRTALLLGMYALVIFTLTFMSVFSKLFEDQAPRFAREMSAGYDVLVESNPANPVPTEQLERRDDVAAATGFARGFPEFTAGGEGSEPRPWAMSGVDERLLAERPPVLSERQPAFATDREAWEAVVADPDLAVVPSFFLQEGPGGPPARTLGPGDTFTVHNRQTGQERTLTVAGVVESDFLFNGVMVSRDLTDQLLGPQAAVSRHYVKVVPGADAAQVAERLTGDHVAHGADAETFSARVARQLATQQMFFDLLRGYLGLGLLIGIAGLGVVMVRAVRERRRQIGMLRAMGFSTRVVRAAFLFEAGFVALQGIVIGISLALVTSFMMLNNGESFGDSELGFAVPVTALAVVLAGPLVGSLLATYWPSSQASRIHPAVALRIAE